MKRIIIIGGAGFIGINSAYYFIKKGYQVIVLDNLSRKGSTYNLQQLQQKHTVQFVQVDIRNYETLKETLLQIGEVDALLLLAGQVAVTTSITNPREDFEINALGTFNVLEALRNNEQSPHVIYASTNKVYGKMDNVAITKLANRYQYNSDNEGIDEAAPIDFYSPYGCSKGTAEQYVHDYARIYNIPTTVLRQSCIYGPHQFGIEDQGWVAWFTIAATLSVPISIFGDGNQVRDVLHVNDLCRLYELILNNKAICNGQIFNIGGGINNTLSLNELVLLLQNALNTTLNITYDNWRAGDQKVYISNINKATTLLQWKPIIGIEQGILDIKNWTVANIEAIQSYITYK